MTKPLGYGLSARHRRNIAAVLIGLAVIGSGTSRPSQAQGPDTAPSGAASGIMLKDLGVAQGMEQEQELQAIIERAFAEEQKIGTWKRLETRTLELLSPQAWALSTLKQNLTSSTA
ncbi:MAG: hypothetical protein WA970_18445, partial [Gammaproteobacteria bacterium]